MDPENQSKYEFLLKLLEEGDAMVCLDARHPDVSLPKQHKDNPMLNLVFNLGFRRPLDVQADGIYATLAFGGRPHKCVIPFEAVWAIYVPSTQRGQVWEHSIPQDLDLPGQIAQSKKQDAASQTPQAPAGETDPPSEEPETSVTESEKPEPLKPRRDRSHLRVIK